MDNSQKFPFKYGTITVGGRELPAWVYNRVPENMKRVESIEELWIGRPFLYRSRLMPGWYITDYFRSIDRDAVIYMLHNGVEIYVKPR